MNGPQVEAAIDLTCSDGEDDAVTPRRSIASTTSTAAPTATAPTACSTVAKSGKNETVGSSSSKSTSKKKYRPSIGSSSRTLIRKMNLSQYNDDDDNYNNKGEEARYHRPSSSSPSSHPTSYGSKAVASTHRKVSMAGLHHSSRVDRSKKAKRRRSSSSSSSSSSSCSSSSSSSTSLPSSTSNNNISNNNNSIRLLQDSSDDDSVDARPMMKKIDAERKAMTQKGPPFTTASVALTEKSGLLAATAAAASNNNNNNKINASLKTKTKRRVSPPNLPPSLPLPPKHSVPDAVTGTAAATATSRETDDLECYDWDGDDGDVVATASSLPNLSFLQNHCWSCRVELNVPSNRSRSSPRTEPSNDVICCAMHEHPVLQVPMCIVCCEKVKDAEVVVAEGGDDEDNNDVDNEACCGCGVRISDDDDEYEYEGWNRKFFLCDSCPRSMCGRCLAQAHQSTKEICRIDVDDGKWECCYCNPPKFLSILQQRHRSLDNDDSSSTSSLEKSKKSRTVEDILDDLAVVERKKEELDQKMGDWTLLRDEMRQNLLDDFYNDEISDSDVEEAVQSYFDDSMEWIQRYDDFISGLQDELESSHGIDVYQVYANAKQKQTMPGGTNNEVAGNEPEWKRLADLENQKRQQEEDAKYSQTLREETKKARAQKNKEGRTGVSNHNDLSLLDLDEIEDLGTVDKDEEDEEYYRSWTGNFRIQYDDPDSIAEAQAEEDDMLQQNKSVKITTISEYQDYATAKKDARKSAVVRRDVKLQLQNRKTENKIIPKRCNHLAVRRKSSGATTGASKRRNITDQKQRGISCTAIQTDDIAVNHDDDENIWDINRRRSLSMFQESSLVLSHDPYIAIATQISNVLKEHQKEAVMFMFNKCFSDLSASTKSTDHIAGGAVLAHSMGLGKSLSTIALLHALLHLPSPEGSSTRAAKINSVLLVVPVNTIANWENEWEKWTKCMKHRTRVENLADCSNKSVRLKIISKWKERGGVLLTSETVFKNIVGEEGAFTTLCSPGPDVLVIDEAHLMLSKDNKISKSLAKVTTRRRILLTGSPIQNNLLEFYRIMSFVRPGILGTSDKAFQRKYSDPIQKGMPSNASEASKSKADRLLQELTYKTNPFFHRRDAAVLRKDLPPLTQIVVHFRPTKLQRSLFSTYAKLRKSDDNAYTNFLKQYAEMQTVANHPACCILKEDGGKEDKARDHRAEMMKLFADDSDFELDDKNDDLSKKIWWKKEADEFGKKSFLDVESGNKVVALLHILTSATKMNEKTIVFSQSLTLLDYISSIVSSPNWEKLVPSLRESFPGLTGMGGWRADTDFVRIDGGVDGVARGELIESFDRDDAIKCFLLSSKAGGIGINLVAATRCVIFDSSFNPTVDLQSLFRCYRFGQTRNVYAYRLLTEGSMEERVYNRAMNKTGLANRVIDDSDLRRRFTEAEIGLLSKEYDWVCCDECDKWRMLPPDLVADVTTLPTKMYCSDMHFYDQRIDWQDHGCSYPEMTQAFWVEHYAKPNVVLNGESASMTSPVATALSGQELEQLAMEDKILQNLLTVAVKGKQIVQRHYCHDVLNSEGQKVDRKSAVKPSTGAKRKLNMDWNHTHKKSKSDGTGSVPGISMSQQTHASSSSTETESSKTMSKSRSSFVKLEK